MYGHYNAIGSIHYSPDADASTAGNGYQPTIIHTGVVPNLDSPPDTLSVLRLSKSSTLTLIEMQRRLQRAHPKIGMAARHDISIHRDDRSHPCHD